MLKFLLIALGGGVGSILRYLMHEWIQRAAGVRFPFGTLSVNVLGCFAIGCLAALFGEHSQIPKEYRLGLTVGLLGGFTTFSTFGFETFKLFEQGAAGPAFAYLLASGGLGISAVALGFWLVERFA
jgi:CrcB protein